MNTLSARLGPMTVILAATLFNSYLIAGCGGDAGDQAQDPEFDTDSLTSEQRIRACRTACNGDIACDQACDGGGFTACMGPECNEICKAGCDRMPLSDDKKLECREKCDSLHAQPKPSDSCKEGQETDQPPVSVKVVGVGYFGGGCPVGNKDVPLVLVDGGRALELKLPPNTPPITADATTGKTRDRSTCALVWSFANVPDDRCWSVGTTSQEGTADVASGSEARYDIISEIAAGTRSIKQTLSTSGQFVAKVDANSAVCSKPGGIGPYHFHTSVTAKKGSKISIGHIDRIPIRWFACP